MPGANTFRKLAETVEEAETQITLSARLLASNIVLPFTHDVRAMQRQSADSAVGQLHGLVAAPRGSARSQGAAANGEGCAVLFLAELTYQRSRGRPTGTTRPAASSSAAM